MATKAERRLLRHLLASIAYRTQKAIRDAPDGFQDFRASRGVRTPHELIRHMSDVLGYARARLAGGSWRAERLPTLDEELDRLHSILENLSEMLDTARVPSELADRLLQGPLSDAMSHAGQLALLRRLAGSPIPPENFVDARIDTDNPGRTQPDPHSPDREWFDAEDEPY